MRGCITFACAALLGAAPASAATIMLEAEGAEHSAGLNLGMFLGEGVYAARFLLDRAARPGTMLTFIHGVSYDFYGVADGIHYGGNDVPTFRDHAFTGTAFSAILKVQRPYRLVTHWGGDIGDVEERGFYYLEAVYGDFYFASPGPVRLDYAFDRISAVPEPSSWAILIAGFGLAGWSLRRRRTRPALPQPPKFAKTAFRKEQWWENSAYMPGNGFGPCGCGWDSRSRSWLRASAYPTAISASWSMTTGQ
jgi:hypothetical protein